MNTNEWLARANTNAAVLEEFINDWNLTGFTEAVDLMEDLPEDDQ